MRFLATAFCLQVTGITDNIKIRFVSQGGFTLDTDWIKYIPPLLGGGAMGALLTGVISSYRNRIQSVSYRIDILPIFKQTLESSQLQAKVTISEGESQFEFNNLFLVNIEFSNKGNADVSIFPFGITLSNGDISIYNEVKTRDRHHVFEQITPVSSNEPRSEIDFIIKPFNRSDTCQMKLYIVVKQAQTGPSKIQLSSPLPIKFKAVPNIEETIAIIDEITETHPFQIFFLPARLILKLTMLIRRQR